MEEHAQQKKRHIFDAYYRDRLCPVYDIEGKEHGWGKWNGQPATWWIDIGGEIAKGTGVVQEHLVEYHNSQINRPCWDIRVKETNSYKVKWDEDRWSKGCSCEMWANGKLIYKFYTRDIEFAMAKAAVLTVQLMEHSFNFLEQEKERGRKIWWYNLPATILNGYEPGEVRIKPDYTTLSRDEWWAEYIKRSVVQGDDMDRSQERVQERRMDDEINWGDALSDQHINWFRK